MNATLPNSGLIENGAHSYPVRVYYEDTDAGGVVYHAQYLNFAERARTEFMRHLGTAYQKSVLEAGAGFVVRKCEISYNLPAKLDDCLVVVTKIQDKKASSFTLEQNIYAVQDGKDKLLVEMTVILVCVDLARMRPKRIPAALIDDVQQLERQSQLCLDGAKD